MLRWKKNPVRLHAASQLDEVQLKRRRMNELVRDGTQSRAGSEPVEPETKDQGAAAPEADRSDANSQDSANAPTLVMGEGSP